MLIPSHGQGRKSQSSFGVLMILIAQHAKARIISHQAAMRAPAFAPDTDRFSATSEINRVAPEVAVLVLTMSDDDITMTKAMRAGARGYLLQGATKEEILRAVTAVADGQAIFGPAVARRVVARLGAISSEKDPFPQLTPREHDVLRLLAQGLSNSTIAGRLGLSLKTVNNNTSSIFTKLNVATRTEAAILARDRGFGDTRSWLNSLLRTGRHIPGCGANPASCASLCAKTVTSSGHRFSV